MDMIGDISWISDSDTVFHIRLHEVRLVNLLECLFGGLVEIIGATDEDHRPAVCPGIGNSTDSIGMTRSRDTKADSRNASQVSSISSTITSLLLISEAVIVDSIALNGKAKFDDRDAYVK